MIGLQDGAHCKSACPASKQPNAHARPNLLADEDFGLAAADESFLSSSSMKSSGARVQKMSCYAATAAMMSPLEAELMEGLNKAMRDLVAGGQLSAELAELATRVQFIPR